MSCIMLFQMKSLKTIIKILFTVSLFVFLLQKFDINLSVLVTEIKDWRYLLASAVVSLTIVPFISVNRWRSFLKAVGIKEDILVLWHINMISVFQGLLLPSTQGIDVLRMYHLEQRHPKQRGVAGSTVFIERMIGLVLLCLLSLAALPFVVDSGDFMPLFQTIIVISGLVAIAVALILSKKLHGFYTGHNFKNMTIARIFEYIDKFHGAIVHFPYRKVLLPALFLITGYQLAIIFVIYLVFCAYGYAIPFVQHVAIFPVIAILSLAPVTIGGFGVREGFFVFFYSLVGVPPSIAVGASILQYLVLILVPASLGGFLFLWEIYRGKAIGNPK